MAYFFNLEINERKKCLVHVPNLNYRFIKGKINITLNKHELLNNK